jgi:hypothetical protein
MVNRFVLSVIGPKWPNKVIVRSDSYADSRIRAPGQVEVKEPFMDRPVKVPVSERFSAFARVATTP